MGCKVCDIELTASDLFYCNSCENIRRRWEVYCEGNNFYKKNGRNGQPGRKKSTKWNQTN
jgi:hypothetical protein